MFSDWLRIIWSNLLGQSGFILPMWLTMAVAPPNRTVWVEAQFPSFPALYLHNSQVKRR